MGTKKVNKIDPDCHLEKGRVKFKHSNPLKLPQLPNYGAPITKGVARKIIKNYWDKRPSSKAPYAFSFGKESLKLILDQKDCEGIRFYFAEKANSDLFDKNKDGDKWDEGITLVAIGLKREQNQNDTIGDEPEIGSNGKYLIENLKDADDETDSEITLGVILETDPPLPRPPRPKLQKFLNSLNKFYEAY